MVSQQTLEGCVAFLEREDGSACRFQIPSFARRSCARESKSLSLRSWDDCFLMPDFLARKPSALKSCFRTSPSFSSFERLAKRYGFERHPPRPGIGLRPNPPGIGACLGVCNLSTKKPMPCTSPRNFFGYLQSYSCAAMPMRGRGHKQSAPKGNAHAQKCGGRNS